MRLWNALRRGAVTATVSAVLSTMIACGGPSNGAPHVDRFGGATSPNPTGGAVCVQTDVRDYDTVCKVDSDCTPLATGAICAGVCSSPNAAINRDSYAAYQNDTLGEAAECQAPPLGPTLCVANRCVLKLPVANGARSSGGGGSYGSSGSTGGDPDPGVVPVLVAVASGSSDGSDTTSSDDGSSADTSSDSSGDDSSSSGDDSSGDDDDSNDGDTDNSHGTHRLHAAHGAKK